MRKVPSEQGEALEEGIILFRNIVAVVQEPMVGLADQAVSSVGNSMLLGYLLQGSMRDGYGV